MKTVVGVKFKKTSKTYYFDPKDIPLQEGDGAIVETARGLEYGEIVMGPTQVEDEKVVAPLKSVVRKATAGDYKRMEQNQQQEKQAFSVFEQKIAQHKLVMKPVEVEYAFDGSKITFFFTADGRVDFRELVKDLAHHFRARIELRQIGVRDEAKMLGGLGKCGCPICCKRFLSEFSPVSIKMAKEQNISLNPTKISGLCGRLMCCLGYEQKYYEEMNRKMPRNGSEVTTPDGKGKVVENQPLCARTKVRLEKPDGSYEFKVYALEDLTFDRTQRPRPKNEKKNGERKGDREKQKSREPKEENGGKK